MQWETNCEMLLLFVEREMLSKPLNQFPKEAAETNQAFGFQESWADCSLPLVWAVLEVLETHHDPESVLEAQPLLCTPPPAGSSGGNSLLQNQASVSEAHSDAPHPKLFTASSVWPGAAIKLVPFFASSWPSYPTAMAVEGDCNPDLPKKQLLYGEDLANSASGSWGL